MFMGRPLRVARGRQFVKVLSEDGAQSRDESSEPNSDLEQAETSNS